MVSGGPTQTDGIPGRVRQLKDRFQRACLLVSVCLLISLASRLLLRDRYFPFNYNFYLPPLLLLPFVPACLFARLAPRVRLAMLVACILLWLPAALIDQPRLFTGGVSASGETADFRLVTYNVKSYSFGSNRVVDTIVDSKPDILCLVEGTFGSRAPSKVVAALGPDFHWAVGRRLSVASRFPIKESQEVVYMRDLKVLRVVIDAPQGPLVVYNIDVKTPGLRDDQGAFDKLYAAIHDERAPAILTGDFNTPRGSYHILRATEGWTDSFAAASTARYLATWPYMPVPLWQIDHAFNNPGLKPVRAVIGDSHASDHFPLLVDYAYPESD